MCILGALGGVPLSPLLLLRGAGLLRPPDLPGLARQGVLLLLLSDLVELLLLGPQADHRGRL
eukprot:11813190-Alexandrium_andersonii.AAC.1